MTRKNVILLFLLIGLAGCQSAPEPTPTGIPTFELILPPAWTATPTVSPTATVTPPPAATNTATPTAPPPFEKDYDGLLVTLPAAKKSISTPSVWVLVGGFNPLTAPGRRQYSATLADPGTRLWDLELCAAGEDVFATLMSAVEVKFMVNSLDVDSKAIYVEDYGTATSLCRSWSAALSVWRKDFYQLDIRYTLSMDVTDGVNTLPHGLYAHTMRITLPK